jgi:hypothetical protein
MNDPLKSAGYTTLKRRVTMAKKQVQKFSHHEPVVILPLKQADEVYQTINCFKELVPLCNNLEDAIRGINMTPKEKDKATISAIKEIRATLVILNKIT